MAYTVNSLVDLPFQALGDEPSFSPDGLDRFLRQPRIAVLSYLRKDGSPNQVSVWYSYVDGAVSFSMESSSPKVKALRRDPRISVAIQDERPPYRSVVIVGTAELLDHGEDTAVPMSMAVRYFGRIAGALYRRRYRARRASEGTTIVRLVPSAVRGMDGTQSVDVGTLGYLRLRNLLPTRFRIF